jgi:hypothetical protein
MTAPAIGQTSATKTVPYLSNDMFATHARRGVEISGLVPKGDANDQKAALADYIRQGSALMDSFLLGTVAATLDTEVGPVTVKRNGTAVIVPRFRPIIALTAFAAGPNIGQLTTYTDLSMAAVETERILLPVGPFGTWNTSQGPLQLGYPAPVPGQMYARWTTCNGWPVTWLTADLALGATMIPVADTTGIIANSTFMTLYANAYRFTFVPTAVSAASGPGTLTVPACPVAVTNDPLYPTYVSAMPPDLVYAAVLATRALIKGVSGGNYMASTTLPSATRSTDPLGAGDDLALMYEMIDQYQMVQR